jgi:hypothetical protein
MNSNSLLFSSVDWHIVKENIENRIKQEVGEHDGNRLLNTSVDDLCDYLTKKYWLEIPVLQKSSIEADQREAQVDVSHGFRYEHCGIGSTHVPGTTVEIIIPFAGDPDAFKIKPTTYRLDPPHANIQNNSLALEFTGIEMVQEELKTKVDAKISNIEWYLDNLKNDANPLNSSLERIAKKAIEDRKEKLLNAQNLVASLGYPIKERPDSPKTYTAPNVRRKIKPTSPPASSKPYNPEPTLSDHDYNHILDVIQNMTHVMERSPSAFSKMKEEDLRSHFLVQLNGHFEGNATGETFNYEGKTDILIREDGKNLFIGECKFWGGPKKLTETIDQLLGYSSWRDTKVSIIVFNRNKDFTKVLESIKSTVTDHPNCKRFVEQMNETSFRYIFSHRDDRNREMTLTVLAFDVPSA